MMTQRQQEIEKEIMFELAASPGGGSTRLYDYEELDVLRMLASDGFVDCDRETGQWYITDSGMSLVDEEYF